MCANAEIKKSVKYEADLKLLIYSCLLLFVCNVIAQIPNRGYDVSVLGRDSTFSLSRAVPFTQSFDTSTTLFYLRYTVPEKKINRYYDPKSVMPQNRLFLDYRGGSYYVPRMVNNRLAQIMNRPSPDSFVPVFVVGVLAIKLALEYIHIEQKIRINPSDYDLPAELRPILIMLWIKAPQTAFEIYQDEQIRAERTLKILEQQLDILVDKKLLKVKIQEEAPTQYFAALPKEEAQELIRVYLTQENISVSQKQNLQNLLLLLGDL